ncbi:MAG: type VI secretion system membrane subunit TssM [Betaproteobacteria bacterium]|nr:MAG: type VI secretion system membrane subunit TssM [Betaproteobacteria bacterium]
MNLRWIVAAAAWAAFSIAVWFIGDLLALGSHRPLEGTLERMALIVAVGGAFVAWEAWRARRAAKRNDLLLRGIVAGALKGDSAERAANELEVLRKRFAEAAAVLRKARLRTADGERRSVAELPWYMFIGAPGSGKTTALLNAGLRFPLGDPRAGEPALQGVGGTRNCDWWFTEQAVLVDTAGRYTTQETDREADAAAWLGFLDLLKRQRPRQPLNGAIVTLSIADLVHWNEEELSRYARHVRERVGELYARLGVRLPVYLMLTKTDLLAGFNEFFSALDASERAQVWGTTFDAREQARGAAERFKEEFAGLERRLYAFLPRRLQETRDLQKRAAVYRFPQQFRAAGPLIARFLETTFGGAAAGESPMLRGVYFTSGTQEGSPIDRVLATLARSFNLERKVQPPAGGAAKSYFLKRLLQQVVFAESGLAGLDRALERRQRFARLAAYAALAAITVALAAVWTASFVVNRALVARVALQTAGAARELETFAGLRPGDEAKLLAGLTRLRELREASLADSALLHLGLYQGEKLGAQASRAYRNALREGLVADLALSLEHALRSRARSAALAAYMSLHDEAKRDAQTIEQGALAVWSLPQSARAELRTHLREALAEHPLALPHARDESLVEHARRRASGAKT